MINTAIRYLERQTSLKPTVGLVLGSGLGGFVECVEQATEVPYSGIPNFPQSTAVGHAGKMIFGYVGGVPVVVMAGRVHLYEGYTPQQATFPIRVLAKLGIRSLILTNAAGGIHPDYRVGEFVLMSDHINLQGMNPLVGPNDDSLGPRFPDMTEAYPRSLRELAKQAAQESLNLQLKEGVYAALLGPNYETPAEIRYLRAIGADLVGMSTAAESIVANHMRLKVLGISSCVNMAAGMENKTLVHDEVLDVGRQMQKTLIVLLKALIPKLAALPS
jgi:purine-nucleoside phosphorylase